LYVRWHTTCKQHTTFPLDFFRAAAVLLKSEVLKFKGAEGGARDPLHPRAISDIGVASCLPVRVFENGSDTKIEKKLTPTG
jgi:hypothetical protein